MAERFHRPDGSGNSSSVDQEERARVGAWLLSRLMQTADVDLGSFRESKLGADSSVELSHLGLARDILHELHRAIETNDAGLWARVDEAHRALRLRPEPEQIAEQPVVAEVAAPHARPGPERTSAHEHEAGAGTGAPAGAGPAVADPARPYGPAISLPTAGYEPRIVMPAPARDVSGTLNMTVGTAVAAGRAAALPFKPSAEAAPQPPVAAAASREGALGATLPLQSKPTGPALPFSPAGQAPSAFEQVGTAVLTLEQYAELAATRAAWPQQFAAILAVYRVPDEPTYLAFERQWQARFVQQPPLGHQWAVAYERVLARLKDRRR